MAESISAGSTHVARLHHHRQRVHHARAAVTAAAQHAVATHYDHERSAGPQVTAKPPTDADRPTGPPVAENAPSASLGPDKEAPHE